MSSLAADHPDANISVCNHLHLFSIRLEPVQLQSPLIFRDDALQHNTVHSRVISAQETGHSMCFSLSLDELRHPSRLVCAVTPSQERLARLEAALDALGRFRKRHPLNET